MYLITLPQWLIDIWTNYSAIIVPIISTAMPILMAILGLAIKKINKNNEQHIIVDLLQVLTKKENLTKEELEEKTKDLGEIKSLVISLATVINLAYQNSSLAPEIKEQIEVLLDKVKNSSTEELIAEKDRLIEELQQKLEEAGTKIIQETAETIKNTSVRK